MQSEQLGLYWAFSNFSTEGHSQALPRGSGCQLPPLSSGELETHRVRKGGPEQGTNLAVGWRRRALRAARAGPGWRRSHGLGDHAPPLEGKGHPADVGTGAEVSDFGQIAVEVIDEGALEAQRLQQLADPLLQTAGEYVLI